MRGIVPPDPCGEGVSQQHYATVYMPKFRKSRNRFPASCVEFFPDSQQAMQAATTDDKRFAAIVLGPSKSSEGQYIYYLVKWL